MPSVLARCSRYSPNALGLRSLFSLLAHCSRSLLAALATHSARSLLSLPIAALAVVTARSLCSRLWRLRSRSLVLLLVARARCLHRSSPALAAAASSLQFAAVAARCSGSPLSPLAARRSLLTARCSLLTAHRSLLAARCSLLAAVTAHCCHRLLLAAHRSLLSPLAARCSPLAARSPRSLLLLLPLHSSLPLVARARSLLSSLAPRTCCCHCSLPVLAVIAARCPGSVAAVVARSTYSVLSLLSLLAPRARCCPLSLLALRARCCHCSLPRLAASLRALAFAAARSTHSLLSLPRSPCSLFLPTHTPCLLRLHSQYSFQHRSYILFIQQ
jgi:hypothetical protein